jgi:nucleoside-diphosphate-sugar epimerase
MPHAESRTIFLTGATGFIGRYVLRRFIRSGTHKIVCLTRRSNDASDRSDRDGNVEWITGDLGQAATYVESLGEADVVIHLAAATGAASTRELREVNHVGTQTLLAACKDAAARKIVFVSSIAVTGSDIVHYPYAQSKLAAEKAVQDSGLDWVIVRPTIVLGEGAPNWRMLRKLSCLPVVPLFGGGRAKVQPVDVIDVARGLEWLVKNPLVSGRVLEIGGPEVLTFSAFLARIRAACGRGRFCGVSIPVAPARIALKMVKRMLGDRSPLGPGQLAPFINDGVAAPNPVLDALLPGMCPLDELLQRIAHADQGK